MSAYALPFFVVILGIAFFICIVNSIFAAISAKNPSTWRKRSAFTSYKAWLLYAFCIAIIAVVLFAVAGLNVFNGYSNLAQQQQSLSQQLSSSTSDSESSSGTGSAGSGTASTQS